MRQKIDFGIAEYRCLVCMIGFTSKRGLFLHSKIIHDDDIQSRLK